MADYIRRLVACGYTPEKARQICQDFSRNLPLFDLELFVRTTEEYYKKNHVDTIQSKSCR